METPPPTGLVWTDEIVTACVFTGEPLDLGIAMVGMADDVPPQILALGWSEGAACWHGALDDVLAWCDGVGVAPHDAGPFWVEGIEQVSAVHLVSSGTTLPWSEFAGRMGRVQDHATQPPPTVREVRALPVLPETWEVAVDEAEALRVSDGEGPVTLAVVSDAAGLPRAATVHTGPFQLADLSDLVRSATRSQLGTAATSARPSGVRIDDPEAADRLKAALVSSGIRVRLGPTPLADALLDDLRAHLLAASGRRSFPPLFDALDDADVRAYFDAAQRFYQAEPWTRLAPDRYLAVRDVDERPDAPWTYVSVMGQMGAEPGLGLFLDWLDVCALVHDRFRIAGGPDTPGGAAVEGVTLLPRDLLAPADADRLDALGIGPTSGGDFALPVSLSHAVLGASSLPLGLITALLDAIPATIARRRAKTVTSIQATVEAAGGRLALRYPARGDEGVDPALGDVRLTIGPADPADEFLPEALEPGECLVVEGPAGTTAYAIGKAVRSAFESAGRWGMLTALSADGAEVWHGRARATDPAPTLDDLLLAETVGAQMGLTEFPAEVERLPPGAAPALRAELGAGG